MVRSVASNEPDGCLRTPSSFGSCALTNNCHTNLGCDFGQSTPGIELSHLSLGPTLPPERACAAPVPGNLPLHSLENKHLTAQQCPPARLLPIGQTRQKRGNAASETRPVECLRRSLRAREEKEPERKLWADMSDSEEEKELFETSFQVVKRKKARGCRGGARAAKTVKNEEKLDRSDVSRPRVFESSNTSENERNSDPSDVSQQCFLKSSKTNENERNSDPSDVSQTPVFSESADFESKLLALLQKGNRKGTTENQFSQKGFESGVYHSCTTATEFEDARSEKNC